MIVQNKKPVYKKWWFLLFVLLILGGGAYAVWYFGFQKKSSDGGSEPPSDCENGIGEDGQCIPNDGDDSPPGDDSPSPAPPEDDDASGPPPTKPEGKNPGRTAGIAVGTIFAVAFVVGAAWLYNKERHAGVAPTPERIGTGTFVPIIKPGEALETIEEETEEFIRRPKRRIGGDLYNPSKRKRSPDFSELYHDVVHNDLEKEKTVLKWATEALAREALIGKPITRAKYALYVKRNPKLSDLERGWRGKMEPRETRPKLIQYLISEWDSAIPMEDRSLKPYVNLDNSNTLNERQVRKNLDKFYEDHKKSTGWLEEKIKAATKRIEKLEKVAKK